MTDPKQTHILIVEDDPYIATSLRSGLERKSYRVTWKDKGEEGIAFAKKHAPELIILDVRLPDGSGFDFCRRMRMLKLKQPILMLTVRDDEMDKLFGLEK
jgi:DNA-binding response OmpR family regulator